MERKWCLPVDERRACGGSRQEEDNLYLMEIEVNKAYEAYVVRKEGTSSWHEVLGHARSESRSL